jgi:hypothetical protein
MKIEFKGVIFPFQKVNSRYSDTFPTLKGINLGTFPTLKGINFRTFPTLKSIIFGTFPTFVISQQQRFLKKGYIKAVSSFYSW